MKLTELASTLERNSETKVSLQDFLSELIILVLKMSLFMAFFKSLLNIEMVKYFTFCMGLALVYENRHQNFDKIIQVSKKLANKNQLGGKGCVKTPI